MARGLWLVARGSVAGLFGFAPSTRPVAEPGNGLRIHRPQATGRKPASRHKPAVRHKPASRHKPAPGPRPAALEPSQ
jgi:hypothetical protein